MTHPRMYDDADPLLARVRVDPTDEQGMRADARFFVPPYYPDRLALDLDPAETDWDEVAELLEASYRVVASARMLRELDAAR